MRYHFMYLHTSIEPTNEVQNGAETTHFAAYIPLFKNNTKNFIEGSKEIIMFNHYLPSNPHVEKQRQDVIAAVEDAIENNQPYCQIIGTLHPSVLTMLKRGNYQTIEGLEKGTLKECIYIELVQGSSEYAG